MASWAWLVVRVFSAPALKRPPACLLPASESAICAAWKMRGCAARRRSARDCDRYWRESASAMRPANAERSACCLPAAMLAPACRSGRHMRESGRTSCVGRRIQIALNSSIRLSGRACATGAISTSGPATARLSRGAVSSTSLLELREPRLRLSPCQSIFARLSSCQGSAPPRKPAPEAAMRRDERGARRARNPDPARHILLCSGSFRTIGCVVPLVVPRTCSSSSSSKVPLPFLSDRELMRSNPCALSARAQPGGSRSMHRRSHCLTQLPPAGSLFDDFRQVAGGHQPVHVASTRGIMLHLEDDRGARRASSCASPVRTRPSRIRSGRTAVDRFPGSYPGNADILARAPSGPSRLSVLRQDVRRMG